MRKDLVINGIDYNQVIDDLIEMTPVYFDYFVTQRWLEIEYNRTFYPIVSLKDFKPMHDEWEWKMTLNYNRYDGR